MLPTVLVWPISTASVQLTSHLWLYPITILFSGFPSCLRAPVWRAPFLSHLSHFKRFSFYPPVRHCRRTWRLCNWRTLGPSLERIGLAFDNGGRPSVRACVTCVKTRVVCAHACVSNFVLRDGKWGRGWKGPRLSPGISFGRWMIAVELTSTKSLVFTVLLSNAPCVLFIVVHFQLS